VGGQPTGASIRQSFAYPEQGTPLPVLRQKIIVAGQLGVLLHGAPQLCDQALALMQIGGVIRIC
jgi:hypothetical protein